MKIKQMFRDDINRTINGVVQVGQDVDSVLVQELDEYVITRELRKHFITFFNNYGEASNEPNLSTGVWISGFFGSGKSHFLKMLAYLLENKEVDGIKTVERFRKKFDDDPATFMLIDNATKGETDTILFNIDTVNPGAKDETAVRKVFAKMFYNHLGYYGEDLKVAKLEQYVDSLGKTEEFHRVFEEKNGSPWLESRDAFAFFEDDVTETLQEVLGMSENAAQNWFNGEEAQVLSVEKLVAEIKEYVDSKPDNFRLLFMADEVGQFIGEDTSLLLNLQSIVEEISSKCNGKVWVVCTGQEAIDEVIKTRENEFSRIQARFKTRLSLSSASADEVIQKRILAKDDDAAKLLANTYEKSESALKNLFTFTDAIKDIKGYEGEESFIANFPFVPYQFILLQKVFTEVRKHGNSGKHLAGGERSMLSGFQEAAQRIQDKDEYSLAPFYLFYDTVHTFLESAIRNVIERCERAATDGKGVEPQDVNVLKLLYLIRYVKDVPANLDNIVILMADEIELDKVKMRKQVSESLDRLESQNYIGRIGDKYQFLTDEEQDVQKDINKTSVATADITKSIADRIFGDIYMNKKIRYNDNDFSFDQSVDGMDYGQPTGGMKLSVLTVATSDVDKSDAKLLMDSKGQAIIVLPDGNYYEIAEKALKIRKYVKGNNISDMPSSMQAIVEAQQREARNYEDAVKEQIKAAIESATCYVDGERLKSEKVSAKDKIENALTYLVGRVYSEMSLITETATDDGDIRDILAGFGKDAEGNRNQEAAAKVEEYLEMQQMQNLPTTMFDVQSRYKAAPYGWKEIDIAAVVAQLIYDQKVTIKQGGETIQPTNAKLPDMLRKKSEIGKTQISKRQVISAQKMREAREFLRDYLDTMDVPEDEDSLVEFIIDKLSEQGKGYNDLLENYAKHRYPDMGIVSAAVQEIKEVLSHSKDNIALIDSLIKNQDKLYDSSEKMQKVESFFNTQAQLYDHAIDIMEEYRNDSDYLNQDDRAKEAMNQIRLITGEDTPPSEVYKRVPELNELVQTLKDVHLEMRRNIRDGVEADLKTCASQVEAAAKGHDEPAVQKIAESAVGYFAKKNKEIGVVQGLRLLNGIKPELWAEKDKYIDWIEDAIRKVEQPKNTEEAPKTVEAPKPKSVVRISKQAVFPTVKLASEDDVDIYLEKVREELKKQIAEHNEIKIS